jgi:flagellar basal body-associated protein FliL
MQPEQEAYSQLIIQNDPNTKQCRICLGEDGEDFISPCKCRGSAKYVHRVCLDEWRAHSNNNKAFTHCNECRFEYQMEENNNRAGENKRIALYWLSLIKYILGFFCAAEMIIVFTSIVFYSFDYINSKKVLHLFSQDMQNHWIYTYHLMGLLTFFAILGLFGVMLGASGIHTVQINTCCCYGPCGPTCPCPTGSNNGKECLAVLIAIGIILVALGVFIGIAITMDFFHKESIRLRKKLWKVQEAKVYRVVDYTGREHEIY